MLENILTKANYSLAEGKWENGIYSYDQTNCKGTLTNGTLHISRPPNHDGTSSGHQDTWGGLKLYNSNNRFNLQKGHSYILLYDVKGKTSNSIGSGYWTNQMGWGGGGLSPSPSDASSNGGLPSNYSSNTYKTLWYRWTINDDVSKVCTSAYSGFEKGKTYVSYRDFAWGWSYSNTGSLGTDIYIKNFRMYDITNFSKEDVKFLKTGNIEANLFSDAHKKTSIGKYGEINTNDIIEN